MARYHLKDDGTPALCRAEKKGCPKTMEDGSAVPHFDSREEAVRYFENSMESEIVKSPRRKVKYSFLKDFEEQEEKFNESFEGVPQRFFNADLRGKSFILDYSDIDTEDLLREASELSEKGEFRKIRRMVKPRELSKRLFQSMSSPSDSNISEEDLKEIAEGLGASTFRRLDARTAVGAGAKDRAYLMGLKSESGEEVFTIVTDKSRGTFDNYRFRYRKPPEEMGEQIFFVISDIRSMVGAKRLQRKTGKNLFRETILGSSYYGGGRDLTSRMEREGKLSHEAIESMRDLEDAQREGKNFKAQKKFVRESASKVATVWEDKKNQKDEHVKASKETNLLKDFSKVEIDGDVDLNEFKDFESDFAHVRSKLPTIPSDRKPEMRIRKLGKHGSHKTTVHGLYNPVRNSIAIDVRNSSSAIHEMGHYYDLTVKGNSSMSREAYPLMKRYMKGLSTTDEGRREYLSTPTEIYARAFELYSHERLGINNRLLNPDKFDPESDDFSPFFKDEKLKEDFFNFFDRSFKSS